VRGARDSRQPSDGDGSLPIGRAAGGRIEQRVRFPGFCGRCARGGSETGIASEVWISGGKREILGFGLGEVAALLNVDGPWVGLRRMLVALCSLVYILTSGPESSQAYQHHEAINTHAFCKLQTRLE
jgi:hypothetical protein